MRDGRTISQDLTLYFGSQPRMGNTATAQSSLDRLVYLLRALHCEPSVEKLWMTLTGEAVSVRKGIRAAPDFAKE